MNSSKESTDVDQKEDEVDIIPLEPPSPTKDTMKQPLKLMFELIITSLLLLPMIIWSIVEHIMAESKKLDGKVVLVTGSGRGLGRGYAEEFARLGCKIACVDIDQTLNEETVTLINKRYPGVAKAYRCNVAITAEVKELKDSVIRDFGQVNVLINNAGIVSNSEFTKMNDMLIDSTLAVNVKSHLVMIREFLPEMLERNEGHIVAIASMGSIYAFPKGAPYVASKHAVLGLMDTLHYELGEISNNAIQTSVVCPYFVNTSAVYTKHWNLRMPYLSVRTAVRISVEAIRKNRRIITIPPGQYSSSLIVKLLPNRVQCQLRKIFYTEMKPVSKDLIEKAPLYHHLMNSAKKHGTIVN